MKNLLKHNVKRSAVKFCSWLIESINKVFHKGTANTNPIKRNKKGGQDKICHLCGKILNTEYILKHKTDKLCGECLLMLAWRQID